MRVRFIDGGSGSVLRISAKGIDVPRRDDFLVFTVYSDTEHQKTKFVVEKVELDYDLMIANVYLTGV